MAFYTLMLRDIPVISFDMTDGKIQLIMDLYNTDRLPFSLQKELSVEKLQNWYFHRLIPKSRENYRVMNRYFKKQGSNLLSMAEYNYALSLSDQYWIKPEDEENLEWSKINFFSNPFSYDAGNVSFSYGELKNDNPIFVSPDFATNGVAVKAWRIKDDKRFLIKAGQNDKRQEPVNEVAISLYLQQMKFPYLVPAKYSLSKIYGNICCVSENFLNEHTELVTAYDICHYRERADGDTLYSHMISVCNELEIPNAKKFLDSMFLFDSIISNTDRHLGNFGFLRDTETLRFIGPAPLYDNGSSLWADEVLINGGPGIRDEVAKPFSKIHSDQIHDLSYFKMIKQFDVKLFNDIYKEVAKKNLEKEQINYILSKIEYRYEKTIEESEKTIKQRKVMEREKEEELER